MVTHSETPHASQEQVALNPRLLRRDGHRAKKWKLMRRDTETGGQLCPPSPATEDGHPAPPTAPPSWEGQTSSGPPRQVAGRSASVYTGLTPRGAAATSSPSSHQAPVTNTVSETRGRVTARVPSPPSTKGQINTRCTPKLRLSTAAPRPHPTPRETNQSKSTRGERPSLQLLRGHQTEDQVAGNETWGVFK